MSDAIDPEWAAWFTGFLEGEGYFGIRLDGGQRCAIKLRNDDWYVLAGIRDKIGAGFLSIEDNQSDRDLGRKDKDGLAWTVYGLNCLKVVEIVESVDYSSHYSDWLAGFIDAEGCLRITNVGSPQCTISLRDDDGQVLHEISNRTNVGRVYFKNQQSSRRRGLKGAKDSFAWTVCGADCSMIVDLLEGKMRTKKAKDFSIWADAVRFAASQKRGAPGKKEKMLEYKAMLEDARKYVAPSEEELQAVLGKVKEGT